MTVPSLPLFYTIIWGDGRRVTVTDDAVARDEDNVPLTDEELGRAFREFALDQLARHGR